MREHLDLQQITQPQPGTTDLPPAVPPKMHQVSPSLTTNLANHTPMQELSAQAPIVSQFTSQSVLNTQAASPVSAHASVQSVAQAPLASNQTYIAQHSMVSQATSQIMQPQQHTHATHNPYSDATGGRSNLAQTHQSSVIASSDNTATVNMPNSMLGHAQNAVLHPNIHAAMSNHNVMDKSTSEANLNLASTLAPNVTADTLGNYAPSTGYSSLNCGTTQLAHTQLGSLTRANTTVQASHQPINLQSNLQFEQSKHPHIQSQHSSLQTISANISNTAHVANLSASAQNATQGLHDTAQGSFQNATQGTIQATAYNATAASRNISQNAAQNAAQNSTFIAAPNAPSATFAVNNPSYQGLSAASNTLTTATPIASMHDWSEQNPEYINSSSAALASSSTAQAQQPAYTYVPEALNAHLHAASASTPSNSAASKSAASASTPSGAAPSESRLSLSSSTSSQKTAEQGVHLDMFDEGMPKAPPRTTMNLTPSSQGLSFLREQGVDVSASTKKNSSPQSAFDALLKLLGDKANMDNTDFKVSYQDYWIMRRNENRIVQQEVKQSQDQYFKEYMQQVRSANTFNANYTFEKLNCDQLNLNAFMFAKQFADEMAVSLQPNLLLILGNPGTGKTALCHAIAQRYISNKANPEHCTMRRPDLPMVLFSSFSDIVNLKMFTFNESPDERDIREKRFEEICNADMLIIDDIAPDREELSQFAQKILAEIMSVRCDSKLPLVLATPLNNLEIANKVGVRCFERINSFFVVATCLEGNSRRPRAIRLRKWPGLQDNAN